MLPHRLPPLVSSTRSSCPSLCASPPKFCLPSLCLVTPIGTGWDHLTFRKRIQDKQIECSSPLSFAAFQSGSFVSSQPPDGSKSSTFWIQFLPLPWLPWSRFTTLCRLLLGFLSLSFPPLQDHRVSHPVQPSQNPDGQLTSFPSLGPSESKFFI